MTHQLINTGAGWRCLRCKVAWDQGDDAPETCEAGDEYGFVTDLDTLRDFKHDVLVEGARKLNDATQDAFLHGKASFPEGMPRTSFIFASGDAEYLRDETGGRRFWPIGKPLPKPNTMTKQVAGNHYRSLAIQPTEFCMRNGLDFCVGSILKYLTRWRSKNGVEDLSKARHFVEIREAFSYDIHPPRQIAITMLEYVTRNSIRPDDAEALYRLEAYYNATGHHVRIGADRLISEIDRLIARAG